ncbi:hypothetical protein NQ176_g8182 [Zarea fungicola]|uniref:Uncharacterized protein n=1 Tax=Zarea fungicola TaxID=93591 RepID=A0ACC1MTY4_9HYPO|nr:hypothetical protein NQ176_g8182 [Lecanicillium fungicola]
MRVLNGDGHRSKQRRKPPMVPKPNRRRNATATSNVEHEYLQHIAQDRCCRIRNGIGSDENLPNRSGWIPAKLISKIGVMKSNFLAAHPAYAKTLYPLLPSDARTNMWRSDPNNETNSDNWTLPWPPYFDTIPESNNETSDVEMADSSSIGSSFEPEEENGARNKKLRRVRHEDGSYSYETCSDSDSEPKAEGSGKKKGRRHVRRVRNDDGTYMYETDPDSDSGLEDSGRARKKWKRRVRNEDGTYSYESEPDSNFEPEAAEGHTKKRKRRVRHEGGVWYSYETDPDSSSDAQAGKGAQNKGKRQVRRVRNEDGTYSYETDSDSDSALEGRERATKKWKRRVRNQDGTYTYETDSDFDSSFEEIRGAGKKRMRRILTADGEWSYVSDGNWEDALSTDDDGLNPNRRRRRRRRFGDPNYQPPRKGEESDSDQEVPLEKVREELLKEMQSIQDIQDDQGAVKSARFVTPMGLEDFVVGPSHDI